MVIAHYRIAFTLFYSDNCHDGFLLYDEKVIGNAVMQHSDDFGLYTILFYQTSFCRISFMSCAPK